MFLVYTDNLKGFRLLQLNLDIFDNVPQQRVVYYTDEGPSEFIQTYDISGRVFGLLADGFSGFRVLELSSDIGLYPKLDQIIDDQQK